MQDADAERFADKLRAVLVECHRVLKDDGLLVFSYHHSRAEGWAALAQALLGAGFAVVNSHPVRAEMAGAAPKAQAKEPIQLDILLVCRKLACVGRASSEARALSAARDKIARLEASGFTLSRNDRRIVFHGQLLTTLRRLADVRANEARFEHLLVPTPAVAPAASDRRPADGRRTLASVETRQLELLDLTPSR